MISSKSNNAKGVTLVELMVVIAVLGIVLGLVYSIFISQMRSSIWRSQLSEAKQGIDGAMQLMISDYIKADYVVNTTGVCNTTVEVSVDGSEIGYYLKNIKGIPSLIRNGPATDDVVVAENVTDLKFTCYDKNGALEPPPAGGGAYSFGEEKEIRRIKITATGETSRESPVTGEKAKITVTTSIEFRNIPQYAGSGCGVLYLDIADTSVAFCDPPGDTTTVDVWLCNLIGNAMGGDVEIAPKGGLPITITGSGVAEVGGKTIMTIPEPAASALCGDPGTKGTATISADNPAHENLAPGTSLEVVASWQPTDCGYYISTAKSLSIEAGQPYQFENNALGLSHGNSPLGVMNACQSDIKADLSVKMLDNCGHTMEGKSVEFLVYDGNPPPPAGTGSGSPVTGQPNYGNVTATVDDGDGTYSAIYNAGNLATTVYIVAKSTDIVNATNSQITNAIALVPHIPNHLDLTSSSPVGGITGLDECPNISSTINFQVQDECHNPREDEASNFDPDTGAETTRGSIGEVYGSGITYSAIYNTPDDCGAGASEGFYNVLFDHGGIEGDPDLEVPLLLNKCPVPGVSLSLQRPEPIPDNELYAGCLDEEAQITATVWKTGALGTCEPDPTPANIVFEVKNLKKEGGEISYADTDPRNARFLTEVSGSPDLASHEKTNTAGTAIADLVAYGARPGDILYVHAIANIGAWGWAEYTSTDYQIKVMNSPATGNFYTDATYSVIADKYTVPNLVPTLGTGTVYAEVRDCDENLDPVATLDTIEATLSSDDKTGIINTLTVTMLETGLNTGVFRAAVPMKREAEAGKLMVDKGGFITGEYVDDDEHPDLSGTVPLTGCRDFRVVDASDNDIDGLRPDVEEGGVYTEGFPDDYGFYLIMNVPTFAGNGIQNTITVHTCSSVEEDTVTMVEEASDNGILRISNNNPLGNYIFVGEGPDEPVPGGDDSAGIRIAVSPDPITIVYPEHPTTPTVCPNDLNETSLQNWGCYAEFEATDVDAPLVTYNPPADPVKGMVYFTNYLITVDDGPGTIQTVNLKFCNTADCSDIAYTPYSASPGTSTFTSTSDGALADFDSTAILNGTYFTFAEAFDTESNRGVSTTYDRTVQNTCRIDDTGTPLAVTRIAGDNINVSGKFLLNNVGDEATSLSISVTDGDGVPYGPFPATTAANGSFSWNSTVAYVAPVSVSVWGERNLCVAPPATTEETCEVVIDEATATYDVLTGSVYVAWEYLLGGVPHSAVLNATASSAQPASDSAPTVTASSNSWTSAGVFTDNTKPITVTATGQFGQCLESDTVTLTPPLCEITTTTGYDVMTGYTTVNWEFLMDSSPQAAESISGTADSTLGEGPDTYASSGASGIWNSGDGTPTVFTSSVTGTMDGNYGYCVAPQHAFTIPVPACTLSTTQSYDILTGYTTVDWQFLRGGSPQAVSSISGTATSGLPGETDTYSTSGVSSGIWNSAPIVFTDNVTGTLDANYGVCVAPTQNIDIKVPLCSLNVQSSSYNVGDGTVSAKWSLLKDDRSGSGPVAQDATSLSGTATGVVAPAETESTSGSGAFVDWTTSQVYTSDVNVTLDGNYGACAAPQETFTLTRPTCSLNITGQSYDILTGFTTVGWEFYMDSGAGSVAQAADSITGSASSASEGPDTYSASGASGIWNSGDPTTTVFTSSVTGTLDGYFGVCVAPTEPIDIYVPTCSVTVTSQTYNPDGTINVGWQYKLDGAGQAATGSGTATAVAFPSETASSGSLSSDVSGNFTWSPAQTFSSDVSGTVTANYGVCVKSQPIALTRPTCPGDIEFYDNTYSAPATYYDVPTVNPIVNTTAYVQVTDCDENENRSLVDTINVALVTNTASMDPYDTVLATLVETGINTGVFQNAVTMTRWDWLPETLEVEPGSIINSTYWDDDDITDTDIDFIALTGCRVLVVTDAFGNPIWGVGVDTSPYDPTYPDGPTAFHVAMSMPAFAGNLLSDTTTVRVCSEDPFDPLWPPVEDTRVVTLREDPGDTGVMRIDSTVSYPGYDYIYVGEDAAVGPTPGGHADIGIRVPLEPTRIFVGYPAGPDCDFWMNPDYQNYGMCWPMMMPWDLQAQTCVRDFALGDSHKTGMLGDNCYTRWRGTGTDYYAEKYNFTLAGNTYVRIEMTSPVGPMQFDTYLHLVNAGTGTLIEENDDFDPFVSTDSAIVRWLPAGNYTIEATSLDPWTWGEFALSLTDQNQPGLCPLNPILLGGTASGTTSANCGLTQFTAPPPGPPPAGPAGEYYTRHYELTLLAPTTVRFDVSGSGAIPMPSPYVFVYDSNLNYLGNGWKTLTLPLPADTYIIEVVDPTLNTELGYTLSVYKPVTLVLSAPADKDSGWYTSAGVASILPNENYLAGDNGGTEYRDYFIFDLTGVVGTIVDATLSVDQHAYSSLDLSETWALWDVTTPIATLESGAGGVPAFDDLGTGVFYGSTSVTSATATAVVTLNSDAVAALNAAIGGRFAIGGRVTTIVLGGNNETIFGSSQIPPNNRVLTLTIKP